MKSGSSDIATLTLTTPERVFQRSMSQTKSAGSSCAVDQVEERDLRVDAGDDDRRAELVAVLERDADGAAAAHEDLLHARVRCGSRSRTTRPTRRIASETAAHAALLEAPRSEVTVADVADRVVEHHVRGPRLVGPGPRADHAVHGEHRLDRVGLEPVVEQVADAHREQPRDVGDAAHAELAHLPGGLRARRSGRRSRASRASAAPAAAAARARRRRPSATPPTLGIVSASFFENCAIES